MRIAIVSPVISGASGGYRKYMRRLVPLLASDPRVDWLHLYAGPSVLELHQVDPSLVTAWPEADPWRFKWLKAELRLQRAEVVFIPTAGWLNCGPIPVVSMVRNTEPLLVPFSGNTFADGLKNLVRAQLARRACKRSDRVIAVSRHVRDYLADTWEIDPRKIGVVYHGVDRVDVASSEQRPEQLSTKPFVFTAGSIRPARGLEDVVEAMSKLNADLGTLVLAIAGKVDPGAEGCRLKLGQLALRLGVTKRIIWLGQLDAAGMAWCYRHCEAFVMTSRAEACPNTALEALAHGCRVISTTQTPMPEFFENSAAYYQPRNAGSLAKEIATALQWTDEQATARRRDAIARAAQFDWTGTARKTVDELQVAIDRSRCTARKTFLLRRH